MDDNQRCDKIANGKQNQRDVDRPEEVGTALLLYLDVKYEKYFGLFSFFVFTLMIASFSSVLPAGGIGWPFRVKPRLDQVPSLIFIFNYPAVHFVLILLRNLIVVMGI